MTHLQDQHKDDRKKADEQDQGDYDPGEGAARRLGSGSRSSCTNKEARIKPGVTPLHPRSEGLTWGMDGNGPISRPLPCDLPPAAGQRGKPLLHLTEIHPSIFRSWRGHREAEVVAQRAAEAQPAALLKRLQSGVPVSGEYGAMPVLREPRDLELGVPAGLPGDVTGNCEFLGRAHVQLHILLHKGEVVTW